MKEKVLKVLTENCPDVDFFASDKLVDEGILDSLTTIMVISSIAMELGINIPYEEVTTENFNSIDAIVALVAKYS